VEGVSDCWILGSEPEGRVLNPAEAIISSNLYKESYSARLILAKSSTKAQEQRILKGEIDV
jgi:hypothetical protein